MVPINSHDGTDDKMDDAANNCANNEQPSATNAINDKEDSSSCDEENDILDDGRRESGVSGLPGRQ